MEKTTAFIGLGSNLGDGAKILKAAWERLGRASGVTPGILSHPYLTAPVDMESSNWFTNAVGMLETTLPVERLLELLFEIERAFGRTRDSLHAGYQDRSLDLDILCFGELTLDSPELVLPHPRMGGRLFVLAPFAEIDPDWKIPGSGFTAGERYEKMVREMKAGKHPAQEIKRGRWED